MTNIRVVTGLNNKEALNLMRTYNGLARELGTTTKAIAESADNWLRQGYSAQEANKLIKSSTYLSKLGMIDASSATQYLTAVMKGFSLEAEQSMSVVDKLTKLDQQYAASAGEIGEALSRVSAVAQQVGLDLDQTAAAVTLIMDVSQQGAEQAGTALRSIASRYSAINISNYTDVVDEEDLEGVNDIEKALKTVGIATRSSTMEMRDLGDVLDDLSEKWVSLSSVEQNAIATAFAGTRQRNSFLILMEQYEEVKEATEVSANSMGTAEEKYLAYTESI